MRKSQNFESRYELRTYKRVEYVRAVRPGAKLAPIDVDRSLAGFFYRGRYPSLILPVLVHSPDPSSKIFHLSIDKRASPVDQFTQ